MDPIAKTESAKTPSDAMKALKVGAFITLRKIEQGGALQARKLSSGAVQFYWRYRTAEAASDRIPIGIYDSTSPVKSLQPSAKGYSVMAAAEACRAFAIAHRQAASEGGYRASVSAAKQAQELKRIAEAAAKSAEAEALAEHARRAKFTLAAMLAVYVDYLKKERRSSFRDARTIFRLHVEGAWPEIALLPANQVNEEQIADMQRKLVAAGKGRTANKLRSFIGAAYQCALKARTSSTLPCEFVEFRVRANPVAFTSREAKFDRADKRPFTLEELRIYWKSIKQMPGNEGASLRLHLLTGGQRIAQLVRVKLSEVECDRFVMYDGKGRPGSEPRKRVVPLIASAKKSVDLLRNKGEFLISSDHGKTSLRPTTLSNWAKAAPHGIKGFQLKRVRSGIETALAAARISEEDRGHLQSHGRSGVQAKHYDDHDYIEHKRDALKKLYRLLGAGLKVN